MTTDKWTHTEETVLVRIEAPDGRGDLALGFATCGCMPKMVSMELYNEELAGIAGMMGKKLRFTVTVEEIK